MSTEKLQNKSIVGIYWWCGVEQGEGGGYCAYCCNLFCKSIITILTVAGKLFLVHMMALSKSTFHGNS